MSDFLCKIAFRNPEIPDFSGRRRRPGNLSKFGVPGVPAAPSSIRAPPPSIRAPPPTMAQMAAGHARPPQPPLPPGPPPTFFPPPPAQPPLPPGPPPGARAAAAAATGVQSAVNLRASSPSTIRLALSFAPAGKVKAARPKAPPVAQSVVAEMSGEVSEGDGKGGNSMAKVSDAMMPSQPWDPPSSPMGPRLMMTWQVSDAMMRHFRSMTPLDAEAHAAYYSSRFAEADTDESSPQITSTRAAAICSCCAALLRGLRWTLHYYLLGTPSWSWYFPYHHAPLLTDV